MRVCVWVFYIFYIFRIKEPGLVGGRVKDREGFYFRVVDGDGEKEKMLRLLFILSTTGR